MSCFLIVGLPRTGTSILNALIVEQFQCLDLGEKWCINSTDIDIRKYKHNDVIFRNQNLDAAKNFTNHVYYNEQKTRLKYLLSNTQKSCVAKCWVTDFLMHQNIILEECVSNNVRILLTHRKNIADHFSSSVNAANRRNVLINLKKSFPALLKNQKSFFISDEDVLEFTTFNSNANFHLKNLKFHRNDLTDNTFRSYFEIFENSLISWRLFYELYKNHVTVVSYENEIMPLMMENIGITKETIQKYNQKVNHLIPTFVENDTYSDNQEYLRCLNLLKEYQHLLDI